MSKSDNNRLISAGMESASSMQVYTVAEAAEILRIHKHTAYRWIRQGKLPARRLAGGRGVRVTQADIDAFLASATDQEKERAE